MRYFLELCLTSVTQAITNLDAEIIVVDNNSSDDSCTMVTDKFPNVTLIANTENYGFSKGNNSGVKEAKGKYVCILNPDTVVAEDTFATVLDFAETKSDIGILGCKLIDGTGTFLPESKRNVPKPSVALKKIIGFNTSYYASDLNEDEIGKVSVLVGAFMLIPKKVYDEVGGFDEAYFMYGEDIDLSYSIQKLGYTNYYYGKTTVIHFKGESTLKDEIYAKRFYGAMQIFYKKHFKKNVLFDLAVAKGTNIGMLLKPKHKTRVEAKHSYIYLGEELPDYLKENTIDITLKQTIETKENEVCILDNTNLTFKEIIEILEHKTNSNTKFRIIPKAANFMLGSDSSNSRGEIHQF